MHTPSADAPPRPPARWRRRVAAGGLVAGVLALHGSGLRWLAPDPLPGARVAAPALQVRQMVAWPLHASPSLPQLVPARLPPGVTRRRPEPQRLPEAAPEPEVAVDGWVPVAAIEPMLAAAVAAPAASAAAPTQQAGTQAPPTYPTRVAPSFEARYRMHRGALSGDASLQWTHDGKGYQLRLEARVLLLGAVLTQQSTGGFDAAGLAPQRFVDRRLRRSERAVNFVRPADGTPPHVSFSARRGDAPWTAGMQDRLSWVMQLGAIAAAWPGGPHLGESIELDVAGPAGEVQHWVFSVTEAPAGGMVKLVREPNAAYDTAVQVWLDPTRHYQLRRLRLAEARGDALELVRVEPDGTR
jgi:hypothetical protein